VDDFMGECGMQEKKVRHIWFFCLVFDWCKYMHGWSIDKSSCVVRGGVSFGGGALKKLCHMSHGEGRPLRSENEGHWVGYILHVRMVDMFDHSGKTAVVVMTKRGVSQK
jgi:hypothetical protein